MIGFYTIIPEDIEDVVPDAKKSVGRSGEQPVHSVARTARFYQYFK